MALTYSEASNGMDSAFADLQSAYATIGFTSIDNQPVRNPSQADLDLLAEKLNAFSDALSDAQPHESLPERTAEDYTPSAAEVAASDDAAAETPVEPTPPVDYASMTVVELRDLARERGLEGYSGLTKDELIALLGG